MLLHLVDGTSDNVAEDWQTIIRELEAYGGALADKPRITALNKVDALTDEERAEKQAELEAVAGPVKQMSGVAGEGVMDVLRALRRQIDAAKRAEKDATEEPGPWRP